LAISQNRVGCRANRSRDGLTNSQVGIEANKLLAMIASEHESQTGFPWSAIK
jgi:hypothetical protein